MQRPCEVCSGLERVGLPPTTPARRKLRRVLLGDRIVVLCDPHAEELKNHRVDGVEALRERFMEPGGARSLVDRRAPLDRRLFPPRPEGRRRNDGRRATDAED